jgi:DNA-directed RNA polymerase specialized sigma24 family protein
MNTSSKLKTAPRRGFSSALVDHLEIRDRHDRLWFDNLVESICSSPDLDLSQFDGKEPHRNSRVVAENSENAVSAAAFDSTGLCPRVGKKVFIEPLHACLDRLEPNQKLVIHLRFWEEMEISQIAAITSSTWNHVNQLLEWTLIHLQEMLENIRATSYSAEAA